MCRPQQLVVLLKDLLVAELVNILVNFQVYQNLHLHLAEVEDGEGQTEQVPEVEVKLRYETHVPRMNFLCEKHYNICNDDNTHSDVAG